MKTIQKYLWIFTSMFLSSLICFLIFSQTPDIITATPSSQTNTGNKVYLDLPKIDVVTPKCQAVLTNNISLGRADPMFKLDINTTVDYFEENRANNGNCENTDKDIVEYFLNDGVLPVDKDLFSITSFYGPRIHPISGNDDFHTGVDIAKSFKNVSLSAGKPVYSVLAGKVVAVEFGENGYGNNVIVNHGEFETLYAHLDEMAVTVGNNVKAGQTIGNIGNTGLSNGPHLHFEIRIDGEHVNPLSYLELIQLSEADKAVLAELRQKS